MQDADLGVLSSCSWTWIRYKWELKAVCYVVLLFD